MEVGWCERGQRQRREREREGTWERFCDRVARACPLFSGPFVPLSPSYHSHRTPHYPRTTRLHPPPTPTHVFSSIPALRVSFRVSFRPHTALTPPFFLSSSSQLMQSIMGQNPQLQQMMQNNPELRAAMQDPNLMRQAMQAAGNPAMMRQMLQQNDRAMANINAMPGGFNALRRMQEGGELDAFQGAAAGMGAGAGTGAGAGAGTGGGASPGGPMPNPWAAADTSGGASPNSQALPNPWGAPAAPAAPASPFGGMGGMFGGMPPAAAPPPPVEPSKFGHIDLLGSFASQVPAAPAAPACDGEGRDV